MDALILKEFQFPNRTEKENILTQNCRKHKLHNMIKISHQLKDT